MKQLKNTFMLGLLVTTMGLGACGGNSGSLRLDDGYSMYEFDVQNVSCYAGPGFATGSPGYEGISSSPIVCEMRFRTRNSFADTLAFTVHDVYQVYQTYGQEWISLAPGIITVQLRFEGIDQGIRSGEFRFSQISNYAGDRIAGVFILETNLGEMQGQFEGTVEAGY